MKKWIFGFLALLFGFIFSLMLQRDYVPNIFIIEAVVIAIAFFLQIVVRIIVVFNIKKKAEQTYKSAFKCNSIFKLLFSVFPKHISLSGRDKTLNLIIIFVRRRYVKYHFASKNNVEVYRGNIETYRTGKLQYSIGKNVTWKLISKIKISLEENAKTVFVLSRAPMDVTCSDKSANEYLSNGDVFFENCVVYAQKHFIGDM